MADEEVMGAASPAPSDHKRKLDDLDSEPLDQPTATAAAASNGNSDSAAEGEAPVNGVAPGDPEVKRPRLDDKPDEFDATENGHQEEKATESKYNVPEDLASEKTELDEGQEKADEPLDAENKEPLTDENLTSSFEQQPAENPEEAAKGEYHEPSEECQDPPPDATQQEDVSRVEQQPTSADQLTSRKMEVPSNKVGVLIGKGGDTIRTLQYHSGARIQITRDADADPSSVTRPVELIGSVENIDKAEKLIKDVIAEADAGGSPLLVAKGFGTVQSSGAGEQIQIQVPNEKVGLIIGKGGETIKNLQTRSGARIQLIPQHLPEGDQSKERTVRVTGNRKQIEMAREMITEAMNQPIRSSAPSGGHNQQNFRPRGPGSQWGTRNHSSQPTGYDYPPRGPPHPSQNPQYPPQGYGNYPPPQQPPPRNNFGWDQRPQGPSEHTGYDYYGAHGGGHPAPPPAQPPMHSHAPGPTMGPPPPSYPNYNYGPDYGQHPSQYPQTGPQGYGHGHGYGEPKYDNQGPAQHPYGPHGSHPQGLTHPGYGQQDQYGKPPMPQQGAYVQPYGQPRPSQPGEVPYQGPVSSAQPYGPNTAAQQPYPYAPPQQAYAQYGSAPVANDGYGHPAPGPGAHPQQSGQPVSGYAQNVGQQPGPGYAQVGPAAAGGYSQYPPPSQPGYAEQAPANNAGYGYQGAADPAYGGGPGAPPYGGPVGQTGYSLPAPAPAPVQPVYDQSVPQAGGYAPVPYGKSVSPQPQPVQQQTGYGQYDGNHMYAGHR